MSTTRISDVIVPEVFANYVTEDSVIKNAFYQSGVIVTNALIQSKATSGGRTITLPFWRDIVATTADANISSDDPSVESTPQKVQSGVQVAYIGHLNQSWSTMDLTVDLAGTDPLSAVRGSIGGYWANQLAKRLMSTVRGLIALDQVAGGSDDMTFPKEGVAIAAFTPAGVRRAAATMGDNKKSITTIAVHPDIYGEMLDQELIEYIKPSEASVLLIPTYRGMAIIEDEKCPKSADANPVYTSILMGGGAFGAAAGLVANAAAVERKEAVGNGAGMETLYSRIAPIVHPLGYTWKGVSVAGETPTLAEVENAANWERVVTDRRSIPLAFYNSTLPGVVA